jgi:UDP-GlcNAc:undecaprenyl-phosphate GlcNAc-1-phosphate transferase
MILNIFFLIFGFILSVAINWILIHFSFNLGVRNIENEVRWQARKPSLGGISFIIIFLIFALLASFFITQNPSFKEKMNVLGTIISVILGFLIGLIDDAKNTNPLLKLFGQVLCGIIIAAFGILIPISDNTIWNYIFTIFWTVFLMNSINMLDNMDGLTSLISIFILSSILSFNIFCGFEQIYSLIGFATIASLVGFLLFNWSPSKIYMGDSGSQFLGILLSCFSILFTWNYKSEGGGYFQIQQLFLPFFIFTIPIFDTATVFFHRLMKKQSPFVGGKDHLSHHLVYLGFKDYQAVFLLGMFQLIFSIIAFYIYFFQSKVPFIFYFSFAFWIFSFLLIQIIYIIGKNRNVLYEEKPKGSNF